SRRPRIKYMRTDVLYLVRELTFLDPHVVLLTDCFEVGLTEAHLAGTKEGRFLVPCEGKEKVEQFASDNKNEILKRLQIAVFLRKMPLFYQRCCDSLPIGPLFY